MTTVTFTVPANLREKLERVAAANERSLGGETRIALKEYLERVEGDGFGVAA
ncbi:MAG: hypothetical protein ACR2G9_00145 [Gaiellaceae bacterium]